VDYSFSMYFLILLLTSDWFFHFFHDILYYLDIFSCQWIFILMLRFFFIDMGNFGC
jgi:hypothetical protein